MDVKQFFEEKLSFDEQTHTYLVEGEKFTSVTKFIKSHFPEFDANDTFWHGGLQRTFGMAEWVAYAVREEIKGNGPVSKKSNDEFYYSKKLFLDLWQEEVEARQGKKIAINQAEVKKIWDKNNTAASTEGTRIHELIEGYLLGSIDEIDLMEEPRALSGVTQLSYLQNILGYKPVIPELRVFHLEHKLAGTIDLYIDCGEEFVLVDWKTNKEISKQSKNKGMTEATSHLNDSNHTKYTLQLSVYAYIIEQMLGKTCRGLWLYHLTHDGDCDPIPITYEKELVENILYEYNNNN